MTHPSAASLCGAATSSSSRMCSDASSTTVMCSVFTPSSHMGSRRSTRAWNETACSSTCKPPVRPNANHGALNVFVTDVDALYHELQSKGARTVKEPKDYPYGMRDFDIHDLDGNQLCFGMESKQQ